MMENETTTKEKGTRDFTKTYIQLRTVLDALEIMALRHCLKDEDEAERTKRAEKIIKDLMPILKRYQTELQSGSGECPEGFVNCNGCCVPYPCPY